MQHPAERGRLPVAYLIQGKKFAFDKRVEKRHRPLLASRPPLLFDAFLIEAGHAGIVLGDALKKRKEPRIG
jgi:hypothetical protein